MSGKKSRGLTLAVVLAVCGCSPHGGSPASDGPSGLPTGDATAEAGKFLRSLHDQGKLPGLSRDDPGELETSVSDFSAPVQFPLSKTFEFRKDGFIYRYTVEKLDERSDWRLIKAVQTDDTRAVVKEFSTS